MEMKRLKSLIGKQVLALIPVIDPNLFQVVTLRGVEIGGLWIESEDMNQKFLRSMGLPAAPMPIFFVPYVHIKFVMAASEQTALSESAFGV